MMVGVSCILVEFKCQGHSVLSVRSRSFMSLIVNVSISPTKRAVSLRLKGVLVLPILKLSADPTPNIF